MAYKQRTGIPATTRSILTDDPDFLRLIVERVVQAVLEAEMTAHLHAEPYERSAHRTGYRNGYKSRQLNTRVGTLILQVPQDRDGTFSTQLFARYQRNEKALVLALMEMYVEGVSARKVREITETLCGTTFSKSLVSELAVQLDTQLEAWRTRPLSETTYPYLSVDARYEHVRQGGQIVSHGVLIVAGIRADGHREILAVEVADTESEATYHQLFRALKARGLSGVRLVTSDDHTGLKAAIDRHFQGASWNRCQVHFARDLVKLVGTGRRGELAAGCPLGRFPNPAACLRLVTALCVEQSEEWPGGRRYLTMGAAGAAAVTHATIPTVQHSAIRHEEVRDGAEQ
jgi:putative transposase